MTSSGSINHKFAPTYYGKNNQSTLKKLFLLWLILWGILLFVVVLVYDFLSEIDALLILSVTNLFLSIAVLIAFRKIISDSWGSIPIVYLYYFILCHIPLTLFWVFDPEVVLDRFPSSTVYWLRLDSLIPALLLVYISLIAFLLGGLIANFFYYGNRENSQKHQQTTKSWDQGYPPLFFGGILVGLAAIGIFFMAIIRAGGLEALLLPYLLWNEQVAVNTKWAIFLNAIGGGLALVGAPKKYWYLALFPFAFLSIFYLFEGDRGTVLYPLLTYVAIITKKGIHIPRKVIVLIVGSIFILVPTIFQIRHTDLRQEFIDPNNIQIRWQDLLLETGFQIRTVTITHNYLETGQLEFVKGGSYWFPIERQVARFLPFIERETTIENDPRNVRSFSQNWGFSPVAESYYNFGFWGPFIFFPLLGFMLTILDYKSSGAPSYTQAMIVVILFPFIDNIRNAFINVPGRILAGFIVLGCIWAMDKFLYRRKSDN